MGGHENGGAEVIFCRQAERDLVERQSDPLSIDPVHVWEEKETAAEERHQHDDTIDPVQKRVLLLILQGRQERRSTILNG